jgi:hypothetical protein
MYMRAPAFSRSGGNASKTLILAVTRIAQEYGQMAGGIQTRSHWPYSKSRYYPGNILASQNVSLTISGRRFVCW